MNLLIKMGLTPEAEMSIKAMKGGNEPKLSMEELNAGYKSLIDEFSGNGERVFASSKRMGIGDSTGIGDNRGVFPYEIFIVTDKNPHELPSKGIKTNITYKEEEIALSVE